MKSRSIMLWMGLAFSVVTALAWWDEDREAKAALADLAEEHATLANSLAAGLAEALGRTQAPEQLLAAARTIEKPGNTLVLLAAPGSLGLVTGDGRRLRSPSLELASQRGAHAVYLSRAEAAELGLPARVAVAGLRAIATPAGRYIVLVVATAQRERDREQRARYRLLLGVVVAAGLVLAFGGFAMREQRKELELAHRLEIATLQRQRDERLVRADKLATMGALATGIAHELATPLGVILGRAEQLLPKQSDERAQRAVATIVAQAERIAAVIRDFLALARGKQPSMERCAPAALAQAAIDLVEHRFETAGVRLQGQTAADLPEVACEPRLFEQVLINLLLNACDACSEGGLVTLSVIMGQQRVEFLVADDGVGISPDAAERVTEPLYTTKPAGRGTGLGLAIANEIVKHHCGSLVLRPRTTGPGTCASVRLPAAVPTFHEDRVEAVAGEVHG